VLEPVHLSAHALALCGQVPERVVVDQSNGFKREQGNPLSNNREL
jgi:hypothetical protein